MSLELFMNDVIIQPHMKICTECNIPKPATLEYFYREQRVKSGLLACCKECEAKYKKAWYQNGGKEKEHKRRHEKTPYRTAFGKLRNNVKTRGKRKFLLGEAKTPEAEAYIKYLQTITHCPDCSKEVIWYSEGGKKFESASFDRIDSDGDYTKENVRIVCRHCNVRKNDSPVDEWVGLLKVRVEKGIIEEVDPRLTEFLCEEEVVMSLPYTYIIKCPNGKQYYGVRWNNKVSPEEDLWKVYFTSSTYVESLREQYDDSQFIATVDKVFETSDDARAYEEKFLTENNCVRSNDWENRNNAGKEFHAPKGRTPWNKGKTGIYTEEARKKMGVKPKDWRGTAGWKMTEEQRIANSERQKGKKISEEHRKNISKSLIGNTRSVGRKHSDELKRKISEGLKRYHANKKKG
jgi:hypothetical protein